MMPDRKAPQAPLRCVVVGAGYMGANHIKKFQQIGERIDARVTAIVDPMESKAKEIVKSWAPAQRPRVLPHLGALADLPAAEKPEAAIVAVPASIHVETAMACLQQGLHVLVEKPMGFSTMDCRELEAKAKSSKRVLQVGLLERWALSEMWGRWRPRRGPWSINAVRVGPFVPRAADTDVIHDLMIHDIDLFVLLSTVFKLAPIQKVRAWGRKLRSEHIDYAIVALDLEDGGMARFFASRLSAEASRSWEMAGPGWHATMNFMKRSLKRFERVGSGINDFDANESSWVDGDPLGQEIEAFVRRIRGTYTRKHLNEQSLAFCSPEQLVPSAETVIKAHEIIDSVLSNIQVLEQ